VFKLLINKPAQSWVFCRTAPCVQSPTDLSVGAPRRHLEAAGTLYQEK